MQQLVEEIIKIRKKLQNREFSVQQTVLALADIIERFEEQEQDYDGEKEFLKSLLAVKNLGEWKDKNQRTKSKLKNLKILMFLSDFGIDGITEQEIEKILITNLR